MVNYELEKEERRLKELRHYDILDTPPDGAFDDIVKLAAKIFDVPIAIISLVDKDRIWFKSKVGISIPQIEKEQGLCASTIFTKDIYVVERASTDIRTLANKLVTGNFGLEFYAAAPLITKAGHGLGTLCLIDQQARKLTNDQQEMLKSLAQVVMNQMELRLQARTAIKNQTELTYLLTHNLKGFANNIPALVEVLRETKDRPEEFERILQMLVDSSNKSLKEINDFLEQAAMNNSKASYDFVKVDFKEVVKHIVKNNQVVAIEKNQNLKLNFEDRKQIIKADENKLMDAIDNLINNAVKFSPYNATITISTYSKGDRVVLKVQDEGPGLSEFDKKGLFKPFSRLSSKPTGGEVSSGLGLWIVKEIATSHKGEVWATSEGPGKGATFFLEMQLAG